MDARTAITDVRMFLSAVREGNATLDEGDWERINSAVDTLDHVTMPRFARELHYLKDALEQAWDEAIVYAEQVPDGAVEWPQESIHRLITLLRMVDDTHKRLRTLVADDIFGGELEE